MSEPSLAHSAAAGDAASFATYGKTPKGEHTLLTWVLIVLASIAVSLATLAIGVQQLVLNTDRWVATVGPLATDSDVQSSIANAAATQVLGAIDVQGRVQSLPGPIQRLVAPAESGIDSFVNEQALNIARSGQFATAWTSVNRTVHQALVELLRGDTQASPVLRVSNGELQLDILALVPGLEQRLQQLPVNPLAAAPADFGYVSLAAASGLVRAQQAVQLIDRGTLLLVLAAIGLILGSLVISPDRRRTTLRLALGVAIGLLVLGVALLAVQGGLVASVADRPIGGVVQATLSAVLLSLALFMSFVFIADLVVALVAYMMGRQ